MNPNAKLPQPTFNPNAMPPQSDAAKAYAAANNYAFGSTLTAQGDGSYTVKPSKPVAWFTVLQVASILDVHKSSVYRLIWEGKLQAVKPLRKALRISADVLAAHQRNAEDPEYWTAAPAPEARK